MLPHYFSQFLAERHHPKHKKFKSLIENLCEITESGSSCLDLNGHGGLTLEEWTEILTPDADTSTVGSPGANTPLILTPEGKLFLQRYHLHERAVFEIIDKAARSEQLELSDSMRSRVEEVFGSISGNKPADAAISALTNRLTIISGGPGTGKTTTVVKILLLLREFGHFSSPSDCLLLAPTGKAADRLRQSIMNGLKELEKKGFSADDFPTDTSTIHRALGWRPNSIEFRHHADNPLSAKVVIIDETSMVALPLMDRLLNAIPDSAKIILLGDKNQLSSIEVGTVLNDLMDASEQTNHPIRHCSVTLTKSWRTTGAVSEACNAIRDGQADEAWKIITTSSDTSQSETSQNETASENEPILGSIQQTPPPKNLYKELLRFVKKHWLPVLTDTELELDEKLEAIDRFRILTPTHNGPYGVQMINQTVDQILFQEGGLNPNQELWYAGRSVIIQQNDYSLGIFNGDIGLTLPSDALQKEQAPTKPHKNTNTSSLNVYFQNGSELKKIAPSLLPETKTAWALTIHRTQGSEYDHILLIVPPTYQADEKTPSKILSRELLYTGLSRAIKSADLWCTEDDFKHTVHTAVHRASGLTAMFGD